MSNQDILQRDILPIADRPHTGLITYDAKDPDTSFPPIEQLQLPKGAPNIPIVLLGDVGFGAASATPVSDDFGPKDSNFTGQMRWVQIDIDEAAEDLDHLINAEERLRMAMAWQ
jgi:hypothetical protein